MKNIYTFILIGLLFPAFLAFDELFESNGWNKFVDQFMEIFPLLALVLIINKPISYAIEQLDRRVSWEKNKLLRILVDFLLLFGFVTVTVCFLLLVDHYFFSIQRLGIDNELDDLVGGNMSVYFLFIFLKEVFSLAEQKQKLEIEKEKYARQQLISRFQTLKKQLNPHFMFNSLNVLSGLMYENVERADLFVQKLAGIYRYVLEQGEEVMIQLKEEIEFIESYFFLQKIRFENNLDYQLRIDTEKMSWLLPPLTLELLVENAVKHNMISSEKPLKIQVYNEGDYLFIKNKIQLRSEQYQSTKIGHKNLVERFGLMDLTKPEFLIDGEYYIAKVPLLRPAL